MYRYDEFDRSLVNQRVRRFRGQVDRYLKGELADDEFKQLHTLARIADEHDRGYGHFTTRQNIQYNWPALKDVPDILQELADVDLHAIQSSGNCVRNVTSDHLAGVADDEVEDPRPYCEIIRQWSTLHPEFPRLPRKFKIAVTGGARDRAAVKFHDIGLRLVRSVDGEPGFEIWVGGGMGRTPGVPPGDISSAQMHALADITGCYSRDEIRTTHEQNLALAWVRRADLVRVWRGLDRQGPATPNIGILGVDKHGEGRWWWEDSTGKECGLHAGNLREAG